MKIVNIHEAKTHFSQLLNQALAGEEIIIAKGGKAIIRLMPYVEILPPREGGQFRGMMKVSEDFNAPLPDDVWTSLL
jgi:prevent-host-death family protein